jgi:hypothetical protein
MKLVFWLGRGPSPRIALVSWEAGHEELEPVREVLVRSFPVLSPTTQHFRIFCANSPGFRTDAAITRCGLLASSYSINRLIHQPIACLIGSVADTHLKGALRCLPTIGELPTAPPCCDLLS